MKLLYKRKRHRAIIFGMLASIFITTVVFADVEVINTAPKVTVKTNVTKEINNETKLIDLSILTDYTGTKLDNLNSTLQSMQSNVYSSNIDLKSTVYNETTDLPIFSSGLANENTMTFYSRGTPTWSDYYYVFAYITATGTIKGYAGTGPINGGGPPGYIPEDSQLVQLPTINNARQVTSANGILYILTTDGLVYRSNMDFSVTDRINRFDIATITQINGLSNIQKLYCHGEGLYALDKDGKLFVYGKDYMSDINGITVSTPTIVQPFNGITESAKDIGPNCIIARSGNLYMYGWLFYYNGTQTSTTKSGTFPLYKTDVTNAFSIIELANNTKVNMPFLRLNDGSVGYASVDATTQDTVNKKINANLRILTDSEQTFRNVKGVLIDFKKISYIKDNGDVYITTFTTSGYTVSMPYTASYVGNFKTIHNKYKTYLYGSNIKSWQFITYSGTDKNVDLINATPIAVDSTDIKLNDLGNVYEHIRTKQLKLDNYNIRPNSDRYYIYISDSIGKDFSKALGQYYSFGNLNNSLKDYLANNNFNIYSVSNPGDYDTKLTASDIIGINQELSIRELVNSSKVEGKLFNIGEYEKALNSIISRKVDISVLTDYSGTKLNELQTAISKMDSDLYPFNIDLQTTLYDGTDKVLYEPTADDTELKANVESRVASGYKGYVIDSRGDLWQLNKVPEKIKELSNIGKVFTGGFDTFAIDNDGYIWVWGKNSTGMLGLGDTTERTVPVKLTSISNVKSIKVGKRTTFFLDKDGDVWYTGFNIISGTTSYTPKKIPELSNIINIEVGGGTYRYWSVDHYNIGNNYANFALDKDGYVWSWGANYAGVLGLGSSGTVSTPTKIPTLSNIVDIAAGNVHALALDSSGNAWGWGASRDGQLGSVNATNIPVKLTDYPDIVAIDASDFISMLLNKDGILKTFGSVLYDSSSPRSNTLPNVASFSGNNGMLTAMTKDGRVFTSGDNSNLGLGQGLDDSYKEDNPDGSTSTVDLVTTNFGEVATVPQLDSVSITGATNYYKDKSGNTYITDTTTKSPILISEAVNGLNNIVKKFSTVRGDVDFAIDSNGDVYSWGLNSSGQLGLGDTTNRATPTKIPGLSNIIDLYVDSTASSSVAAVYALEGNGNVYSWGTNSFGQLGLGNTTATKVPTKISSLSNIKYILAKGSSVFAIDGSSNMYSWGKNNYGQLGTGNITNALTPIKNTTISNVRKILYYGGSSGGSTYVITNSNELYTFGYNSVGQLGLGNITTTKTPTKVSINNVSDVFFGNNTVHAITAYDTVYSWGDGYYSGAGLGNIDIKTPIQNANLSNKQIITISQAVNGGTSWAVTKTGSVLKWSTSVPSVAYTIKYMDKAYSCVDGLVVIDKLGDTHTIGTNTNNQLLMGSLAGQYGTYGTSLLRGDDMINVIPRGTAKLMPFYSISTENVLAAQPRTGSQRYFIYISDGTGKDYTQEFGQYYGFASLSNTFKDYLVNNKYNIYSVSNASDYDTKLSAAEKGSTAQELSIRELVNASLLDGKLFNSGEYQSAIDYIIAKCYLPPDPSLSYITTEDVIDYQTTYSDLENDPKNDERWMFEHDSTAVKNNNGLAYFNAQWLKTPIKQFSQVGKYYVTYQAQDRASFIPGFDNYNKWSVDIRQLKLLVHRKPIARFSYNLSVFDSSSMSVSLNSTSYDLDHLDEVKKGIILESWSWQTVGDTKVNYGKLDKIQNGQLYTVTLKVFDVEGAWSDSYSLEIGNNNKPIANFSLQSTFMKQGQINAITDNSYDPDGDTISNWSWRLCDQLGNLITNYGEVKPNLSSLPNGYYLLKLAVKDNPKIPPAMWSEDFSVYFVIISGIVTGHVNHTDTWNANRISYNMNKTNSVDSPRTIDYFFPGENFILSAETTPGANAQSVMVSIEGTSFSTYLSEAFSDIWVGELWDESMLEWDNRTVKFTFTATYPNNYITSHDVYIKIDIGDDGFWRQHMEF